jgi:hypothetical protein
MVYHKQKQWRELVDMRDRELSKQEIKDIKRKRNSDLVWLNDLWIYKEIHPYIHQANRNAGWNFEWD